MPVPGYQEFMLPLLRHAADGQEHKITDAIDVLADQLGVSESERNAMLPSGTQTQLYNRVTWALTYLTKSLLLEKTGRGQFRIAPRGVDALKQNPPKVDNAFLTRFDEFRAFKKKKAASRLSPHHRRTTTGMRLKAPLRPSSVLRVGTTSCVRHWPTSCWPACGS